MYQSPFLLAGFLPGNADRKELQLARKKMLASLELNGGATLNVQGIELSRQDINALFETLSDDTQWQLHQAIFEDKPLLHFLTTGQTDASVVLNTAPIYFSARKYSSPIVAGAIQALLNSILKGSMPAEFFNAVRPLLSILLPGDFDRSMQYTFRYFTLRSRTLEEAIDNEKKGVLNGIDDATEWLDASRSLLLNTLPGDFSDLRFSIARDLNNLSVALGNNYKFIEAYAVIQKAARLTTTTSLMAIIQENVARYQAKANAAVSRTAGATESGGQKPMSNVFGSSYAQRRNRAYMGMTIFLLTAFVFMIVSLKVSRKHSTEKPSVMAAQEIRKDSVQMQNDRVYRLLKTALMQTQQAADTGASELVISLPLDSAEDGFRNVWASLFENAKGMNADSQGAAQVLLRNELRDQDVFVLVNVDSRQFKSIYLTPGQTKVVGYRGMEQADFNFYIGRNWSSEVRHRLTLPRKVNEPFKTITLTGGFLQVPANDSDYLNPAYGVFARTGMEGKRPYRDTASITEDEKGQILFNLGLDERDF